MDHMHFLEVVTRHHKKKKFVIWNVSWKWHDRSVIS